VLFDEYARAACNLGLPADGGLVCRREVVSLTFLDAWPKRGRIEADEALRPWLLGIAVKVSRDLARASRRSDAQIPRDHDAPQSRAWCP
jgi:DNA-directed RNA polymerase specialized sigma24 family protein